MQIKRSALKRVASFPDRKRKEISKLRDQLSNRSCIRINSVAFDSAIDRLFLRRTFLETFYSI